VCRGIDHGGKRCPESPEARAAHNARRRRARHLDNQIREWADQDETTREEAAGLKGPALRNWAEVHGAPAEVTTLPEHPTAAQLEAYKDGLWRTDAMILNGPCLPHAWWLTQNQGDVPEEQRLLVTSFVQANTVRHQEDDDGSAFGQPGVNWTQRMTLKDGTFAFHKSIYGIDDEAAEEFGHKDGEPYQTFHEVAAWRLARHLGSPWNSMIPPVVLAPDHENRLGSLAQGVPGDISSGARIYKRDEFKDQIKAAAFFDTLIGQQDRHGGNALVDGDKLYLIDHGFTFALPGDPEGANNFRYVRSTTNPELTPRERTALNHLLRSTDAFGLEHFMEPARVQALRNRARTMLLFNDIKLEEGV
jgi:hypothetical protein